jgi:glycolate oxidase
MPEPDPAILARRDEITAGLRRLLPAESVIAEPLRLRAYETDALTAYRQMPLAVALPSTTAEVARILQYAHEAGVNVVPRGAGTSLSGGAIPAADAIVVGLGKFNRILDIDYPNRCVVAQSGVTNLSPARSVEMSPRTRAVCIA